MHLYNLISFVIILASLFAIFNQRWLRLPNNIGVMLIAIVVSIIILAINLRYPQRFDETIGLIEDVNFTDVLIKVLLNFLLFAGTIQIRIKDLKKQQLPVLLFATLGVLISAFIIGSLLYYSSRWLGFNIPFIDWLLFGALISPTDPVSVLGIIKEVKIPKSLEIKITGESLFNDGIALVLFVTILRAMHNPEEALSVTAIGKVFFVEVLGAVILGVALGFIGLRVLAKTPDPKIHVMFTLAMVMGGQLLASWLEVSAPLITVTAGIFLGNYGKKYAMHKDTADYLDIFWEVVDEVLNVILFALIGFQLIVIKDYNNYWKIGLLAILIVLIARFISILLPSLIVRLKQRMPMRVVLFLTWGGLRGGISIALALSLSYAHHKNLFVFITYCIVVFSIVVQGLTLERFFLRRRNGQTAVIESDNVGDENLEKNN